MLATVNSLCVYTIYFSGNRFFKANRIRNNIMFKTNMMGDDPMIKSKKDVFQILTNMEVKWTQEQKEG